MHDTSLENSWTHMRFVAFKLGTVDNHVYEGASYWWCTTISSQSSLVLACGLRPDRFLVSDVLIRCPVEPHTYISKIFVSNWTIMILLDKTIDTKGGSYDASAPMSSFIVMHPQVYTLNSSIPDNTYLSFYNMHLKHGQVHQIPKCCKLIPRTSWPGFQRLIGQAYLRRHGKTPTYIQKRLAAAFSFVQLFPSGLQEDGIDCGFVIHLQRVYARFSRGTRMIGTVYPLHNNPLVQDAMNFWLLVFF